MKLGNTGGKNKGKKYLKITGEEAVKPENKVKAEAFGRWFGNIYPTIVREHIGNNIYNEDILNDTFLKIYDKILYGGLEIVNYKSYFCRAYFTNFMQNRIKKQNYPDIYIDDSNDYYSLADNSYYEQEENLIRAELFDDILHYVENKFGSDSCDLFVKYMQDGDVTYNSLSGQMNVPVHIVRYSIGRITGKIRRNPEYLARRKAM